MHRLFTGLLIVGFLIVGTGVALAAEDGKALYDSKCALCHGKDGVAKPPAKGSKNFNDPAFQAETSPDTIAKMIADGKNKMPAFKSKLSPEQITAIAAHVKTLGPAK
jgi:mono/diheme cytochrome c family protein